jgi:hypothetical protein
MRMFLGSCAHCEGALNEHEPTVEVRDPAWNEKFEEPNEPVTIHRWCYEDNKDYWMLVEYNE